MCCGTGLRFCGSSWSINRLPVFICFILKQGQGLSPFSAHAYTEFTEVPLSSPLPHPAPLLLGSGISELIIKQIVTLSKYGHDALDICHS